MATRKGVTKKKVIHDEVLTQYFNQMVGAEDPKFGIIVPKYQKMMEHMTKIRGVLDVFARSPVCVTMRTMGISTQPLLDFIAGMSKLISDGILVERTSKVIPPEILERIGGDAGKLLEYQMGVESSYHLEDFHVRYKAFKNCSQISSIIISMSRLRALLSVEQLRTRRKCLEDRDHLCADFITQAVGMSVQIFEFWEVDWKSLMLRDDFPEEMTNYVLRVMRVFHDNGGVIHQQITEPDIDVDVFAQVIVSSIDKMRHTVPNCDAAFDEIVKSVGLFKTNFGGYYKDFVSSNTPSIIIEGFIGDVAAKTSKTKPMVGRQFKRIMQFYAEKMKSDATIDPNIRRIIQLGLQHVAGDDDSTKPETAAAAAAASADVQIDANRAAHTPPAPIPVTQSTTDAAEVDIIAVATPPAIVVPQ